MDLTLYKGRPKSGDGRLEKEMRCYDLLDSLGIDYWRTDHPDAQAFTMEACREIDGVLGATVCKNLFLTNRQHTSYYLLMMPGDKIFKTKELPGQIDTHPTLTQRLKDKGHAVKLIVDEDVLKGEYVGCHPCINTSSLKLRTQDMFGPLLKALGHEMITVTLKGE